MERVLITTWQNELAADHYSYKNISNSGYHAINRQSLHTGGGLPHLTQQFTVHTLAPRNLLLYPRSNDASECLRMTMQDFNFLYQDDTDDVNTFSNILWKIEKSSRLIAEKSSNLMGSYQFTNEELASRLYSNATA